MPDSAGRNSPPNSPRIDRHAGIVFGGIVLYVHPPVFLGLLFTHRVKLRSSSGRMFTQMTQTKLVKSNDSAVFAGVWTGRNAHGKFTAVAILPSENHPVEECVEF